jgi:hypothetical protein
LYQASLLPENGIQAYCLSAFLDLFLLSILDNSIVLARRRLLEPDILHLRVHKKKTIQAITIAMYFPSQVIS